MGKNPGYGNWVCTYLRSLLQLLAEFSVLLLRLSIFMALLSSISIRYNVYKSRAKFKSHLFYHFKGRNSNKIRICTVIPVRSWNFKDGGS